MYTVSIPINTATCINFGIEKSIAEAKRAKADRIMLTLSSGPGDTGYTNDEETKSRIISSLSNAYHAFKKEGFEVGVWLWTFMLPKDGKYTCIESPLGIIDHSEACPTDKSFVAFASEYIRSLAAIGLDFILFDDDYRLGFFSNVLMGCTCPNHMKLISEDLGENLERADIKNYLLSGGKNKYRSAFIKANRKSLLDFAYAMRKAVDSVSPGTRLGVCSCISSWDIDGADSCEIAKALAGNTKPLLRLIGAPYWAAQNAWGNKLSDVIELSRLERSWCSDDIEIISEGDGYPRPRFYTPASYLEMYDLALRADGTFNGILKYMFDYVSSADYERKYIDTHEKNLDLYKRIDAIFGNKSACGIRVFEAARKYENMDIPESRSETEFAANMFFPISTKVTGYTSVPTKYYGEGVGIAFGENVKYIPENAAKSGLITDIDGAILLHEKGTDIGLVSVGESITPFKEEFLDGEAVRLADVRARNIKVSPKVKVRSNLFFENGECAGSYLYENANREKFCVLNFEAYGYTNFNSNDSYYCNYERQKEMAFIYTALCGKRLPVHSVGNPYFYLLAKKNAEDDAMAVCAFNFSADEICDGTILLDNEYKSIEFLTCSGKLNGNEVVLDRLSAFSYAIFEVKR